MFVDVNTINKEFTMITTVLISSSSERSYISLLYEITVEAFVVVYHTIEIYRRLVIFDFETVYI